MLVLVVVLVLLVVVLLVLVVLVVLLVVLLVVVDDGLADVVELEDVVVPGIMVVLVVVEVGSPLQHWQATSSSMRMMQGACFASRSRNTSLPGEVPAASASFTRASPE